MLFTALDEGRLHLTAIWVLAPHLTSENIEELIEACTHRRKAEIEEILAHRFSLGKPEPRVRLITPIAPPRSAPLQPEHASTLDVFAEHAPGHVPASHAAPPERFLLQLMIDKETRDRLQHALALLSHAGPTAMSAKC